MRLLHYWYPVALGWSLTMVVQRATGRMADPDGVAALLCGIVAAYSFDRAFDHSEAASRRWMTRLLAGAGSISAILCLVAAWRLPVQTSALIPALGVATVFYPRLKQSPLTKTLVLPVIWTWAAIALPFNDGSWFGWHALRLPIAAPLLLLIAAGCLLCDLKDEVQDRHDGVRSVPAMLGGAAATRIAIGLALTAAGLALFEHRPGIAVSALALGVATTSPALLATDAAGPLLVDVILTLPGILISARVV